MTQYSDLKLPSRMHGGIGGMLITLLVIAAVGGATYFAVSSMLGGSDEDTEQASQAEQGLTKADAERIGREEGAKVAREVGYQTALDLAQASGGAALYGDSYAAAETTDYGSYSDDAGGSSAASGDYGSFGGGADSGSYDSYGAGGSTDSGASSTADADNNDSYDYGSSDNYDSPDYGTESASSDNYESPDYGSSSTTSDSYDSADYGSSGSSDTAASDDYASDDFGSDDYATDDYASDDYTSDDFGASDNTTASSSQTASTAPARSDPDEPEPGVRGKAPPPATTLQPWWPPVKSQSSGAMKVLYAGTFAGGNGKGIGVLFGDAVKSGQSFGDFIKVLDDTGEAVSVEWSTATNPALLKTGSLKPGRYLVQLKPGLQSAQGRTQSLALEGPVFID